jgi:hypothetical protein
VNSITKAEALQLCKWAQADSAELIDGLCTLLAMDSDYEKEDCEMHKASCVGSFPDASSRLSNCANMQTELYYNCNATVGEVEECFSQFSTYFRSLDCSQFGDVSHGPDCAEETGSECLKWLMY